MKSANLTDPENPRDIHHVIIKSWPHKEATIGELMRRGVPVRPAEMAMIDFKVMLYTCQRNKLDPVQSANMMYSTVVDTYQNEDGSWKYMN